MDTKPVVISLICGLLLIVLGCQQPASTITAEIELPRKIAATNPAVYEWTRAIVGDAIEVQYFGPADEATSDDWIPDRKQINELQGCGVIVGNGPGAKFADWIDQITIDPNRLCQTTDALAVSQFIAVKNYQTVHSHGPGGEHSHRYVVPNCWLDPSIAWQQATFIADRLSRDFPELADGIGNGLKDLKPKFDALIQRAENLRLNFSAREQPFFISENPQAAYLLRAVGVQDRSLMIDPEMTVDQFTAALQKIETTDAAAFVWIDEPKSEFVEQVSKQIKTEITIRVFNQTDSAKSWFEVVNEDLDQLEVVLEPTTAQ